MQHRTRDVIRLDNPAHATLLDSHSASLFVPDAWTGRRILLKPAPGVNWSAVRTEVGDPVKRNGVWEMTGALEPGRWQRVVVEGGPIGGALLEACDPLHIAAIDAWYASAEALSIRVRLSSSPAAIGRTGLITLLFTLTDERGNLAGRQEVLVGPKTAELAVAMAITRRLADRCRLKAVLSVDQQVVDDAWIDVPELE